MHIFEISAAFETDTFPAISNSNAAVAKTINYFDY